MPDVAMISERIVAITHEYEAELQDFVPERLAPTLLQPSVNQALGHVRWMCQQVRVFVAEGHLSKADRWLGFIQGVLWLAGRGTIGAFREDNR